MSKEPKVTPLVELLTWKDLKKAGRTLYESFEDDDVDKFLLRHLANDPQRLEYVKLLFYEAFVSLYLLRGLAFAVKGEDHENSDTFESVALWEIPNGGSTDDYWTLFRTGFAKFGWYTGAEGRRRVFGDFFHTLHDTYDDIIQLDANPNNVYKLVWLGSTPASRGKGNVRALFDYMFEHYIEPANAVTYLESSMPRNVPIYERFGFRPVADLWVGDKNDPNDHVRIEAMIRGPKGEEWDHLNEYRDERKYVVPKTSCEA